MIQLEKRKQLGVNMEDMRVAMHYIEPNKWSQTLPDNDTLEEWIKKKASFKHVEACEYLLHCGVGERISNWPAPLQESANEAKTSGFTFICYYA